MRMMLVEIAEKLVEALPRRHAVRTFLAQSPLSEEAVGVAGTL